MKEAEGARRAQLLGLIRDLAAIPGPSGREGAIRARIRELVEPVAEEIRIDPLGNLIAAARSKGGAAGARPRRIMLAAHMDEIGVIAIHVDDDGFIRVRPIGGVSPTMLLGQRVRFTNGTTGVVGIEKTEGPKDITFDKLFVDIGAASKGEALEKVRVGDAAGLWHGVETAGEHRVVGRSLDNRTGCAVLVQALRELAEEPGPHQVFFVFTVQEEVGLRGAGPAAFGLEPDMALAVDVTATGDTPKAQTMDVALGKGVAVKVQDRSIIAHWAVKELLVETAEAHGIPYQMEVLPFGGTDAGAIHLTRAGVPSGVVSLPCRYLHTPAEMVDLRDLDAAVSLLLATLRRETLPVGGA